MSVTLFLYQETPLHQAEGEEKVCAANVHDAGMWVSVQGELRPHVLTPRTKEGQRHYCIISN